MGAWLLSPAPHSSSQHSSSQQSLPGPLLEAAVDQLMDTAPCEPMEDMLGTPGGISGSPATTKTQNVVSILGAAAFGRLSLNT